MIRFAKNNKKFRVDAGAPSPNPPGSMMANINTGTNLSAVFDILSAYNVQNQLPYRFIGLTIS
jgi:hypothetical protein